MPISHRGFLFTLVVAGGLALVSPAPADRPLTLRFAADDTGDIAIVGNVLQTCPASAAACEDAQQGIGSVLNNNGFVMGYVDDGDPSTFTASGADLELPAGATVLFAGLYYGARTTRGTGGALPLDGTVAGRSTVKFRPPGQPGYVTLGPAGTVLDSGSSGVYAGFLDVTSVVAAAGLGLVLSGGRASRDRPGSIRGLGSRRRVPRHGPARAEPGRVRRARVGLGYRHVEHGDRLQSPGGRARCGPRSAAWATKATVAHPATRCG